MDMSRYHRDLFNSHSELSKMRDEINETIRCFRQMEEAMDHSIAHKLLDVSLIGSALYVALVHVEDAIIVIEEETLIQAKNE